MRAKIYCSTTTMSKKMLAAAVAVASFVVTAVVAQDFSGRKLWDVSRCDCEQSTINQKADEKK